MPELPEVETIARLLRQPAGLPFSDPTDLKTRPGVVNRVVSNVEINWHRSIAFPDWAAFSKGLQNRKIVNVSRRAKYLLFELDHNWMLIHLRMSGDIRVEPRISSLNLPHDRVILNFQDDARMVFNDTRKFGRLWLLEDPLQVLSKLGPEPFLPELTPEGFFESLNNRKRAIKPLLLDQAFIAGLGNIYTDEALHIAGIHPLQKAASINREQAGVLLQAIRSVLQEGIRRNGASIDWVYRGGDFQNYFSVYQRSGEPCLVCGVKIERIVVSQRGTHFCPNCQKHQCD